MKLKWSNYSPNQIVTAYRDYVIIINSKTGSGFIKKHIGSLYVLDTIKSTRSAMYMIDDIIYKDKHPIKWFLSNKLGIDL